MKPLFLPGTWDISRTFQTFQISRQVASILVAILLAKSTLSIEDIGQYEQLLFLGHILTFFWLQGLIQGFVAASPREDKTNQRFLEQLAAGLLLFIGSILGGLSWVWAGPFSHLFTGGVVQIIYWQLFVFFFLPTQITSLVEHVYLLRNDQQGLFKWTLFSSAGLILAFILPVWWVGTLEAGIYGLMVYASIRLVWMMLLIRPVFSIRDAGNLLTRWSALSIPLIGYAIAGGATVIVDGWIINNHFQDARVFAIFRYGARELPFSMAFASGVGTAAIALLATQWTTGLDDLKHRVSRLSHLLFPITLVLIATSHWWFTRLFSPDFAASAEVFNIYLMIIVSRVILTSPLITAKGNTGVILLIGLIELLVNVVLSLIFVHYWGIAGVAAATVIAYMFEKVVHLVYIQWKYNLRPSSYLPVWTILGYSILMIMTYVLVHLFL